MRGSDALVQMMEQVSVEVIFGLCGDTSLPLYESLFKRWITDHGEIMR
jgi:acetolactate synthase-1/2/3 large subunit